jgi:hypothetical protein
MLTFYRPNNKPFLEMLEAGFKYGMQSKLYIWKKRKSKTASQSESAFDTGTTGGDKNMAMRAGGMRLSGSKLRDLAWSLDVLDLQKEKN